MGFSAGPAMSSRRIVRSTPLQGLGLLGIAALWGCANVGPPRPPSLNLPRVATDLTSERVGDEVRLHWTQPSETTEAEPVRGEMTAELCLRADGSSKPEDGCDADRRVRVTAGGVSESILLPPELALGVPTLLHVRVRVLNAAQRSAGWSNQAMAAGGAAVLPVEKLKATSTDQGLRLEWTRVPGEAVVELRRTQLKLGAETGGAGAGQKGSGARKASTGTRKSSSIGATSPPPAEVRLTVPKGRPTGAEPDPGGTIDGSAGEGVRYSYTAERVRTVDLGGRLVTMRSVPSAAVESVLTDTFPPHFPEGLTSIPVARSGSQPASIDLSWEAGSEPDLAGYIVYRFERESIGSAGECKRLTPKALVAPAFRDFEVTAGRRYSYRVTAVDRSGNESPPSGTVEEELGP